MPPPGSSKLPKGISGKQVCKALERVGFERKRQRGSHIVLRRDEPFARVIVPDHKAVRPGTLRAILRQAGVTPWQFLELL